MINSFEMFVQNCIDYLKVVFLQEHGQKYSVNCKVMNNSYNKQYEGLLALNK